MTGVVKREQPLPEENEPSRQPVADAATSDPLKSLLSSEFIEALDEATEKLPVEQRAVFVLRVHEEMRYDEIAGILDISTGTVMSRLFRARVKLKKMMKDYL